MHHCRTNAPCRSTENAREPMINIETIGSTNATARNKPKRASSRFETATKGRLAP